MGASGYRRITAAGLKENPRQFPSEGIQIYKMTLSVFYCGPGATPAIFTGIVSFEALTTNLHA